MLSSNTYSTSLFCVLADARETRRVDTYISALFPEKSRAYIQKMIEEEKITTNGTYFSKNKKIYRGDVIEIRWIVEDMHLEAQDIPIDIVFENEDFAVINKDPHMNTHPTPGAEGRKGTLVNALLYHFKTLGIRSDEYTSLQPSPIGEGECIDDDTLDVHTEEVYTDTENIKDIDKKITPLPPLSGGLNLRNIHVHTDQYIQSSALSSRDPLETSSPTEVYVHVPLSGGEGLGVRWSSIINGVEKPGIVHRLDKDTSGLIIIAKNDKSMHALQLKMEKRTVSKTYLAVVYGIVPDESGYIESYIGRDPYDRKKMTVHTPNNPKLAKTKFKKIRTIDGAYTLLEVDLLTGRTHQIRVHLASIWYPIVGDSIYGIEKINKQVQEKYGLCRQWLHAYRLSFTLFGVEYAFVGGLKEDLKKIVDIND